MKYYLSSYKLGTEVEKLKELIQQTSARFAYIPNALDEAGEPWSGKEAHMEEDMEDLRNTGAQVELLDLKDYFHKEDELKLKLDTLGGVYVSGGNTFVLRQAMKLSGFDTALLNMANRNDFVYAGYSAAVCVLAPNLKAYAITDDATVMPYPEISEPIWEGLGILDFVFEPHYDSDHAESASTAKEIEFCVQNKILFKAYRDGEVLVIEKF